MPRPNVEAERKIQILEATCEVIREIGMHKMRLSEVAHQAGVSPGMVHYYFNNKRAVLAEAFEFNFTKSMIRRRAMLKATDAPLAQLYRLVYSYVPNEDESLRTWRVWAELWAEAMRDPEFQTVNERLYGEWRQLVTDIIASAQADGSVRKGDPVELANMIIGMIDGLATQVLVQSSQMTPTRMHNTLGAFIDSYLAATPADGTTTPRPVARSRKRVGHP
jgi:AcrR family transcriptional regulator